MPGRERSADELSISDDFRGDFPQKKHKKNPNTKGYLDISKMTDTERKAKIAALIAKNNPLTKDEDEVVLNLQKVRKDMRSNDTVAGIFVIILTIVNFFEVSQYQKESSDGSKAQNESGPLNVYLRSFMWLLGFVITIHIYFHYKYKLELEKLLKLRYEKETLITSGLWKYMIGEMVFAMAISPPKIDFKYEFKQLGIYYTITLNGVLFSINLTKFYFLTRLFEHYSRWTNERAHTVCKKFRCKADTIFLIKCELKNKPYTMVAILFIFCLLIFGVAVRTYEITYSFNMDPDTFDFNSWFNCFWLMIVTMTTVGYGDGYPSTHPGRLFTFIACMLGTVLVSLMVVSLTNTSELTYGQQKVYNEMLKLGAKADAESKGASF